MGLVEKLFDMLFTQSRCARNQGLEMFCCFQREISIFSQQIWVNWLKNYLICFSKKGKLTHKLFKSAKIVEISIFSQQKWVNWLKNYLICFSKKGKLTHKLFKSAKIVEISIFSQQKWVNWLKNYL